MTLPAEDRFARMARRGPAVGSRRVTMVSDLADALAERLSIATQFGWPAPQYAQNPVGFAADILGVELWKRQIEIIEAVRDNARTGAVSGQKTGKTLVAAVAALWAYGTVPGIRVYLLAPRAGQVQGILWPEIMRLHRGSGRCLDCGLDVPIPCPHSHVLDGELSPRATTGLRGAEDGRAIIAVTAKTIEALAGYSGPQLWIIDESSGVDDHVFDVIDGNGLGGGLKALYLGNPTKNRGRLFEIFNSPKRAAAYARVKMSSEEAASARNRHGQPFGHLAKQAEIDERRELWGEDSSLYLIRVKGEYALLDDGAIFSALAIQEAIERWEEDPASGRLFIGLDPAGASGLGDESVFAIRRGTKCIQLIALRGLNEEAHLLELVSLLDQHRRERETPVVVVDREGAIGSVLHARILEYRERFRGRQAPWEYVPVKASAAAERMPGAYPRVRDELLANLERWFRTGSIPDDDKLSAELNAVQWVEQIDQRLKATPKDEIRKELERSPDRMDALALACWESISLRMDAGDLPPSAAALLDRDRSSRAADLEPIAGWEGFDEGDGGRSGRRRDAHRTTAAQRGRR